MDLTEKKKNGQNEKVYIDNMGAENNLHTPLDIVLKKIIKH